MKNKWKEGIGNRLLKKKPKIQPKDGEYNRNEGT